MTSESSQAALRAHIHPTFLLLPIPYDNYHNKYHDKITMISPKGEMDSALSIPDLSHQTSTRVRGPFYVLEHRFPYSVTLDILR